MILDKATSDKMNKEVQSYRLITVATLVDRLKINGSLARKALNELEEKGTIKKVVGHSKLSIYSTSRTIRNLAGRIGILIYEQREQQPPNKLTPNRVLNWRLRGLYLRQYFARDSDFARVLFYGFERKQGAS